MSNRIDTSVNSMVCDEHFVNKVDLEGAVGQVFFVRVTEIGCGGQTSGNRGGFDK